MKNNFITKNKKTLMIGGGILLAGIVFFVILKKKKPMVPGIDGGGSININPSKGISWPLKRKAGLLTNSAEQEVIRNLQKYLNTKITYVEIPLEEDGYFGEKTESRVQNILGVKTVSYSLYNEILNKKSVYTIGQGLNI